MTLINKSNNIITIVVSGVTSIVYPSQGVDPSMLGLEEEKEEDKEINCICCVCTNCKVVYCSGNAIKCKKVPHKIEEFKLYNSPIHYTNSMGGIDSKSDIEELRTQALEACGLGKCTCDFVTQLLPYGCKCGGE